MPPKPLTKRQQQALNTKKKIYDIAAKLISDHGFEHVTVDQICKEAGVAKGGFYHHFTSKDEIIIEIYRQIDSDLIEAMGQMEKGLDWRGRIKFATWFMAKTADSYEPAFCRQIYRSQVETGTGFLLSPDRPFYSTVHSSLQEAQRMGRVAKSLSASDTARMIMALARGIIYDWGLSDGNYNVMEYMDRSVSIFLNGISDSTSC